MDIENIFQSNDYPTPQNIKNDGKIHRFGKKDKYWYICYDNWIVAGDWTGNLPKISQPINQVQYNFLPFPDREYLKHKAKQAIKKADAERQKDYEKTALEAQSLWHDLKNEGESLYLQNKNLKPIQGIKFGNDYCGNFIAIALIDNDDKIWTLQKIYDKTFVKGGNKSFLKGGKVKGCYSLFGNLKSLTIYICEGVATALSVLLAMPESLVVVAYSCHNFDLVAKSIKTRFKGAKIHIIADNDLIKSEVKNG